jgi:hypothetical protein
MKVPTRSARTRDILTFGVVRLHTLIPVAVAAILSGCSGDNASPTAPNPSVAERASLPGSPAFSASDNSTWNYSSFYVDYVRNDISCLGEPMHFFGPNFFRYHQVTSDAGNFHYHFQILPQTPNLPPFIGVGLVTGRVFTYKNGGPYNEVYHIGPGESITVTANETYIGSDGTTFGDTYRLHITNNANGVITASREVPVAFTCT